MDTPAGQNQDEQGQGSKIGSRLTVAGIFALAGARLGAEVGILFNLLTGKGRQHIPSSDNILMKSAKALTSSVWQKSNLIAAVTGAGVLGVLGWMRGDRIDHPIDVLKHPLESLRRIFGVKKKEHGEASTPNPVISGTENILMSPVLSVQDENSWQRKISAEASVVQQSGIK